ncbi:flavodoxin family protein [Gorillibacterium timonense]|uniref:flavodoxin family protein n=1 Tax=Gorillibacterium timonense TaxID=1689269 RepID=UPI00071E2978|nr:flavodoxin family protein [Gorillibacterium timonense]
MKMLVHDLEQREFETWYGEVDADTIVVSDNGRIRHCIGCFGCWIKTPGVCVLKDGYQQMGERLSKCDELVIVSRCLYGSYSPFVRNVWDRSIPYLLPYFATLNGETHHKNRYDNHFELNVHFYGDDITEAERETAKSLVAANAINFYAKENHVHFHNSLQELKGVLQ